MHASQARRIARAWVDTLVPDMEGLIGAHLVGGITSMPDDAPFPATKDVDLHLIFAEGSPALSLMDPFPNILEASFQGLMMEAGLRSVSDYASPAAVLGNPEIAHHLLLDAVLYDPQGLLSALGPVVQGEYARPEWVRARIEHERTGLNRALGFRDLARIHYGVSGELNMLGYSATFAGAVLDVALLRPPRIGGGYLVRLGATLADLEQLDLFEQTLALLGVGGVTAGQATGLLDRGASLFDTAVAIRRAPHFFQHKLHPHMREYFVAACRDMIAAGHPREAAAWITPYICACTDVILTEGAAEQQAWAREQFAELCVVLGVIDDTTMDRRFALAPTLFGAIFALAERLAAERAAVIV